MLNCSRWRLHWAQTIIFPFRFIAEQQRDRESTATIFICTFKMLLWHRNCLIAQIHLWMSWGLLCVCLYCLRYSISFSMLLAHIGSVQAGINSQHLLKKMSFEMFSFIEPHSFELIFPRFLLWIKLWTCDGFVDLHRLLCVCAIVSAFVYYNSNKEVTIQPFHLFYGLVNFFAIRLQFAHTQDSVRSRNIR